MRSSNPVVEHISWLLKIAGSILCSVVLNLTMLQGHHVSDNAAYLEVWCEWRAGLVGGMALVVGNWIW